VVIVGPTAVGKTATAIRLAQRFHGEIISADSRTFYRGMDIGTAKPSPEERQAVPHHLVDILEPNQSFTLAEFRDLALRIAHEITQRGHLPFLVGGSGLYITAVVHGYVIPEVAPDPGLRRTLQEEARRWGPGHLYAELQRADPIAAEKIHPHNIRRIIRALEVYRRTGMPISQLQRRQPPPFTPILIGLTRSWPSLEQAIIARTDAMLAAGLVDEMRRLVAQGYGYDLPSMSGIGYREAGQFLRGEIDEETLRTLIIRNTRRLARRQYQWFRPSDPSIHWVNLDEPDSEDRLVGYLSQRLAEWRA